MIRRTLDYIYNRGAQARDFLQNPAFEEAMREVEQDLMTEWKSSKLKDSETREKAYLAVRALNDVKARLNAYVETAAFERKRAEDAEKAKKPKP